MVLSSPQAIHACFENYPPVRQRLIFKGRVLVDDAVLSTVGVVDGSQVFMTARLQSGVEYPSEQPSPSPAPSSAASSQAGPPSGSASSLGDQGGTLLIPLDASSFGGAGLAAIIGQALSAVMGGGRGGGSRMSGQGDTQISVSLLPIQLGAASANPAHSALMRQHRRVSDGRSARGTPGRSPATSAASAERAAPSPAPAAGMSPSPSVGTDIRTDQARPEGEPLPGRASAQSAAAVPATQQESTINAALDDIFAGISTTATPAAPLPRAVESRPVPTIILPSTAGVPHPHRHTEPVSANATSTRAFPGLPPPLPPPPAAFMLQALPSVSPGMLQPQLQLHVPGAMMGARLSFPVDAGGPATAVPQGFSVPFSQGQGLVSTASHAPTADGEQPLVRIEMNGQWAVRLAGPSLVASLAAFGAHHRQQLHHAAPSADVTAAETSLQSLLGGRITETNCSFTTPTGVIRFVQQAGGPLTVSHFVQSANAGNDASQNAGLRVDSVRHDATVPVNSAPLQPQSTGSDRLGASVRGLVTTAPSPVVASESPASDATKPATSASPIRSARNASSPVACPVSYSGQPLRRVSTRVTAASFEPPVALVSNVGLHHTVTPSRSAYGRRQPLPTSGVRRQEGAVPVRASPSPPPDRSRRSPRQSRAADHAGLTPPAPAAPAASSSPAPVSARGVPSATPQPMDRQLAELQLQVANLQHQIQSQQAQHAVIFQQQQMWFQAAAAWYSQQQQLALAQQGASGGSVTTAAGSSGRGGDNATPSRTHAARATPEPPSSFAANLRGALSGGGSQGGGHPQRSRATAPASSPASPRSRDPGTPRPTAPAAGQSEVPTAAGGTATNNLAAPAGAESVPKSHSE